MSSFSKKVKKIQALSPDIKVSEEQGCIVLRGIVDDWNTIIKAGLLAVDKKRYYGVINDIKLKGFYEAARLPSEKDNIYHEQRPDVLIIGGGIVGCATARELSKYKLDIMVIEKGADVAAGQSSRNGGAVHVGINYSPKSQKHIYNHKGNEMYPSLSKDLDVPFERAGHLMLIAKKWERILINLLILNSKRLKIEGARYLNREQLLEIEPYAPSWAYGALYMPTGGFTSPYKMTIALAENAIVNGARICLNTAALSMNVMDNEIISVKTNRGVIYPKIVINASGVYADIIADMANDKTFTIHPRKGTDIILDKKVGVKLNTTMVKSPITVLNDGLKMSLKKRLDLIKFSLSHENTSKGIAIIHTVDKNMIIGPNVIETPSREDTTTDKENTDLIIAEQMKMAEYIQPTDVIAYFSGVRAPTYEEDFQVRKGIFTKNILHAAGIQSPGLTAAPAIAKDLSKWAIEYLSNNQEIKENLAFNPKQPKKPCLSQMNDEKRNALIKKNPDYGQIVCRCEEISKGEILDALDSPLAVYSLDAIKRRCRPGMGRCQGSFCGPQVMKILAEKKGCAIDKITKSNAEGIILYRKTKETQ